MTSLTFAGSVLLQELADERSLDSTPPRNSGTRVEGPTTSPAATAPVRAETQAAIASQAQPLGSRPKEA